MAVFLNEKFQKLSDVDLLVLHDIFCCIWLSAVSIIKRISRNYGDSADNTHQLKITASVFSLETEVSCNNQWCDLSKSKRVANSSYKMFFHRFLLSKGRLPVRFFEIGTVVHRV